MLEVVINKSLSIVECSKLLRGKCICSTQHVCSTTPKLHGLTLTQYWGAYERSIQMPGTSTSFQTHPDLNIRTKQTFTWHQQCHFYKALSTWHWISQKHAMERVPWKTWQTEMSLTVPAYQILKLFEQLKLNSLVRLFKIAEEDIKRSGVLAPLHLKGAPGMMRIHQLIATKPGTGEVSSFCDHACGCFNLIQGIWFPKLWKWKLLSHFLKWVSGSP